jgi:predicted signal transduction protein with EAL and GGDEF domain
MNRERRADSEGRLAARALRECWPVPADRRAELVRILLDLAVSPEAAPRERVMAIKSLLAAGRLNIEAIRTAQAADYEDVLDRLAALQGTLTRGELADGAGEAG